MNANIQVGDLVYMPNEHVPEGHIPSIGIIIADDYLSIDSLARGKKKSRIGVMWADSDTRVDYEPRAWLKVVL
jgi:hypothetical protein